MAREAVTAPDWFRPGERARLKPVLSAHFGCPGPGTLRPCYTERFIKGGRLNLKLDDGKLFVVLPTDVEWEGYEFDESMTVVCNAAP